MPIHPTAIVDAQARIAETAGIGPCCIIGAEVEIGPRTRLMAGNYLEGPAWIGEDNVFFPYSTVGDCLLMTYAHVAHDVRIGIHVILGNSVGLAGHVIIEDWADISPYSGVHQFCRIGRHAFIGPYSVVKQDVLP